MSWLWTFTSSHFFQTNFAIRGFHILCLLIVHWFLFVICLPGGLYPWHRANHGESSGESYTWRIVICEVVNMDTKSWNRSQHVMKGVEPMKVVKLIAKLVCKIMKLTDFALLWIHLKVVKHIFERNWTTISICIYFPKNTKYSTQLEGPMCWVNKKVTHAFQRIFVTEAKKILYFFSGDSSSICKM